MDRSAVITPKDRARFTLMGAIGCVISRVYFNAPETPGEVHHLLNGGGRRRGHQATVYLHAWYHRGVPPLIGSRQLTKQEATDRYGPSLAESRPAFEARFGTDDDLLEMQNALIDAYVAQIGPVMARRGAA